MQSPLKYLFALYEQASDKQKLAIIQAADDIANGAEWSPSTTDALERAFSESGWLDTLDFQDVQDMMKEKTKRQGCCRILTTGITRKIKGEVTWN